MKPIHKKIFIISAICIVPVVFYVSKNYKSIPANEPYQETTALSPIVKNSDAQTEHITKTHPSSIERQPSENKKQEIANYLNVPSTKKQISKNLDLLVSQISETNLANFASKLQIPFDADQMELNKKNIGEALKVALTKAIEEEMNEKLTLTEVKTLMAQQNLPGVVKLDQNEDTLLDTPEGRKEYENFAKNPQLSEMTLQRKKQIELIINNSNTPEYMMEFMDLENQNQSEAMKQQLGKAVVSELTTMYTYLSKDLSNEEFKDIAETLSSSENDRMTEIILSSMKKVIAIPLTEE